MNLVSFKLPGKVNFTRQRQPPEVFYKKDALKDFSKFTGKHMFQSLFFNEIAG